MTPQQKHVCLLLGAGGTNLDSIFRDIRRVTTHLSVIELDGTTSLESRNATQLNWRKWYEGKWLHAKSMNDLMAVAENLNMVDPIDGIVTFTEQLILPCSQIAESLRLIGNPVESVLIAQNKWKQREALRREGIPSVPFHPIFSLSDIAPAIYAVGFPGIVKPIHGASSFLVKKVTNEAELIFAVMDGFPRLTEVLIPTQQLGFVYERYLPHQNSVLPSGIADYISVESITQNGITKCIAVLDKLPMKIEFVEEGDLVPSVLPTSLQTIAFQYAEKVIAAIGIRNGPTHIELKLTEHGPILLELNARVGGATASVFEASADFSIVAESVKVALGIPIRKTWNFLRAAIFRSISFPYPKFILESQTPANTLKDRFPYVRFIRQRFLSGTRLDSRGPGIQSTRTICTYVASGNDRSQLHSQIEDIESAINLVCTPEPNGKLSPRSHLLLLDRRGLDLYTLPRDIDVTLLCTLDTLPKVAPGTVTRALPVDFLDRKSILDLVDTIHRVTPFTAVVSASEAHMLLVGEIEEVIEHDSKTHGTTGER